MSPSEYDLERPWLRQPFDTDQGWALFSEWLLTPAPRSLRDFAQRTRGVWTFGALEALAWEYGWRERAAAWDSHVDVLRFRAVETELETSAKSAARRHGRVARELVELAAKEIAKLLSASKSSDGFGLLRPADVVRFATEGAKLERLVMGDATERVEQQDGTDLSRLDAEELRALKHLTDKAKGVDSTKAA